MLERVLKTALAALLLGGHVFAWEFPDRRKDQFLSEEGYLFMPAPYSMPGIGEGVALYGGFNNYLGQSDLFGVRTYGDAEGNMLGLWDLHLIKRRWFADVTYLNMTKTGVNQYASRGMDSGKNDYAVAQSDHLENLMLKNTLSFYDRRLELTADYFHQSYRVTTLRDPDGHLIEEINDPKIRDQENLALRFLFDLTDDRQDPIRGVRLNLELSKSPRQSGFDPDFYTATANLAGYLPVHDRSTFVLNWMRSDAFVTREGEGDKAIIADRLGYGGCWPYCPQSVVDQVANQALHNRLGDAKTLGGESRLRAYPGGRFSGAHSQLFGGELRWNFSAERKPVDFLFMKDIRTGVQAALFHEIGTAADDEGDLWKKSRSATGIGVRFVMGSGFVYRFDYATGDEGGQMVIFVSYPWEEL